MIMIIIIVVIFIIIYSFMYLWDISNSVAVYYTCVKRKGSLRNSIGDLFLALGQVLMVCGLVFFPVS